MSFQYIPKATRRRVAKAAYHRCGYCLTPQSIIGPLLEIDHIIPEAHGGSSDEENLWLACPICNASKSSRVNAIDLETDLTVPLFNPRQDVWIGHFRWIEDSTVIHGLTAIGRATIEALNMNHPDIVAARQLWVTAGWHPPADSLIAE